MYIAFKLSYLGIKEYSGFQKQPNVDTIENTIIKALTRAKIGFISDSLEYAGRTDKGVNAWDQTIKIKIDATILPSRILFRINAELPKWIFFWAYSVVNEDFSPRFDALLRHYTYIYINRKEETLSLDKMKDCAEILIGTHNFQNFSKRDSSVKDSIRMIKEIDIIPLDGISGYMIRISGKSFLWQMVRRIVKHLVEIGKGEIEFQRTKDLLLGKSEKIPEPLPPENLILEKIDYSKTITWTIERAIMLNISNEFQKEINKYLEKMTVFNHLSHLQSIYKENFP